MTFGISQNTFFKFKPMAVTLYPLIRPPGELNYWDFGPGELLTEVVYQNGQYLVQLPLCGAGDCQRPEHQTEMLDLLGCCLGTWRFREVTSRQGSAGACQ